MFGIIRRGIIGSFSCLAAQSSHRMTSSSERLGKLPSYIHTTSILLTLCLRPTSYTQSAIYIAPQNLSPWNYLRGVFSCTGTPLSSLIPFCLTFAPIAPLPGSDAVPVEAESSVEDITSSHALDLLAEIYANEAKSVAKQGNGSEGEKNRREESKRNAVKALELLAERYDPIRAGYWDWRKREVLAV